MRDASFILGRAGSRVLAVMLLAAATALGGCAGGGGAANSYAMAPSAGSGATVAFESIDGPPPQVFDRMVGVIDSESKLRSLSVVSREGTAAYRVRSYLSAQVVRGKTVIAWVWDVYDANQQRALRLSGEEPTSAKGGRDPWGAADDLVLRKIAQAGFSGLSNMINGTPDAPGTAPGLRGPAVASVIPQGPVAEMPATALGYADR
ncbi:MULTISPECIES: hypothetical protein [Bradyrhizobium]|uniref:Uncharacterized protein n=1 Tax=Bradyrhizobium ottawaense TaxID=931866 RepID=A0ABV4FLJ7_9BRAD|nr:MULTISPECIES: hypothetical protein [Bradyrhizobium]MBR1294643.1 hypothetical protein [Bradyrhizobium ottawaense]MBR1360833.1 hypothetical protein [Bradyrhizobium ottawaense]MDA9417834.1 hypothetical protein [Bradyrhizobium sp. CCBAU 25360]MDA9447412.1 hypothetical protein [Bradyrhizobium sp. CCBAU 21360]MDA9457897.1 hypothetical protein [Bradyrhizobium sp. CCBAU 21359]